MFPINQTEEKEKDLEIGTSKIYLVGFEVWYFSFCLSFYFTLCNVCFTFCCYNVKARYIAILI